MSQDQAEYKTEVEEALAMLGVGYDDNNPAVIIEKPRIDLAVHDDGLREYKVWGWVKKSAKFIFHVRKLRGAKLSVWEVLSLSINENGECEMSLGDLVKLTGYSRSEVSESLRELEEMGYLSVQKEAGKKGIFKPSFAARGENYPSDEPIQKLDGSDTRPVSNHDHPSSLSNINFSPSFNRVKRVKTVSSVEKDNFDTAMAFEKLAEQAKQSGYWQGRENIPPHLLKYADWWNKRTGQVMKGKVKSDYLKEWAAWNNDELPISALDEAFDYVNGWKGRQGGKVAHPREITKDAAGFAAHPKQEETKHETGKGFYG